jgi:ribose transport system substrate-binding protein
MRKKSTLLFTALLSGCIVLAGCGNQNASSPADSENKAAEQAAKIPSSGPLTVNPELPDEQVIGTGPFGEQAVSAKELQLTEEELAKIKKGNYKAAIAMHYAGTTYMEAQLEAFKAAFDRMGIEIVGVTDAQFKPEKQVSDIETLLAKKPDILISVPVDPVSTAPAFKKAAEAGVKVVFMDGVAKDMKPGKDYVSIVTGDNAGNGRASAEIMADKLGGKGKIGVIYHDADFFVTNQRSDTFEKTIKEKYPNIKIVARGGITTPNDGEKVASGMLTQHPDLDGIFAVWDTPAEGALAAARTAGRNDLVIITTDLGVNVGLEIASDGIVKGLGAQLPYDQGLAEAIIAGYALIGKEAPPFIETPPVKVTKDNILEAWQLVYRKDAPKLIQDAVGK